MPPGRRPGSFFARHRREILAMVGGALAAIAFLVFLGGPDRVGVGTGTFASPEPTGPRTGRGGGRAADSSVVAADSPTRTVEPPGTEPDPSSSAVEADAAPRTPAAAAEEVAALDRDALDRPASASPRTATEAETMAAARADRAGGGDPVRAVTDPRSLASRSARDDAAPPEPAPTEGRATRRAGDDAAPGADTAADDPTGSDPTGVETTPETGAPGENAVPATAVEARVAAEVAVTRYARAVESGDLEALRRVHPGLTPASEAAWREVFENGETFVARLRIAEFTSSGTEARAAVRGSCHFYDLSLRRFVDVPVEFQLFLHHDGRTWRPVLASGEPPGAES